MCNFWSWSTYKCFAGPEFFGRTNLGACCKKTRKPKQTKKTLLFLQSWWVIFLEKASIQVLQQYSYPHTFYNNIPQVWFSLRKFFLLKNPENFSHGSFDFFCHLMLLTFFLLSHLNLRSLQTSEYYSLAFWQILSAISFHSILPHPSQILTSLPFPVSWL